MDPNSDSIPDLERIEAAIAAIFRHCSFPPISCGFLTPLRSVKICGVVVFRSDHDNIMIPNDQTNELVSGLDDSNFKCFPQNYVL